MKPYSSNVSPKQRAAGLPREVVERALNHPLLRALVPTGVGFYPDADGHRIECPKGVDQALLIFCVKGRGWCEIHGVRHPVGPGDLLIIPPFTSHVCGADEAEPWTIPWVQIAGDHVNRLLAQLGVSAEKPVIPLGHDPKVLALFDDVITSAEDIQTYSTTNLFHSAQTAGHLVARILWQQRQQSTVWPTAKQRILQSIEFVKEHLSEGLQLSRIAAVAGMSPSHYCFVFRKETGSSPMEYLIHLRMARACELLDSTELAIKEIARQVGYPDPSYFTRTFHAQKGMSPGEYRERPRR